MSLAWSDPQEDEEEYLDTLEDLEDVWMRNPSRKLQWLRCPVMGYFCNLVTVTGRKFNEPGVQLWFGFECPP